MPTTLDMNLTRITTIRGLARDAFGNDEDAEEFFQATHGGLTAAALGVPGGFVSPNDIIEGSDGQRLLESYFASMIARRNEPVVQ